MKKLIVSTFCASATLLAFSVTADEIIVEGNLKVEESLIVIGDNGVVFKGGGPVDWNTPGPGSIPDDSNDARFMWYPAKGALRFGSPRSPSWSAWPDSNIGIYSAAWGEASVASGGRSTALGAQSAALGDSSIAWGAFSTAVGGNSTAWGVFSTAVGINSTAWGLFTEALGDRSTVWGSNSVASGYNSTAWGNYVIAESTLSTAIGRYNVGGGHPSIWNAEDPLFEIGNGTLQHRSNALTIYKNGNMDLGGNLDVNGAASFAGPVRIQPSGDISMGAFTAEP